MSLGTNDGAEIAATLLRLASGGMLLAHAWLKFFVFTAEGTAGYFASLGLPGFLAYVVIALEALGGAAMILGLRTRIAALALLPVMIGATYFGHWANGFFFTNANGGWEFPAFWTVVLVAQALLGSGRYSVDRAI
jgi:putative oxidoreductase